MPSNKQDSFASLNHDLILAAAESTGLRCSGRILQLNSMENRVFSLELEDDAKQSIIIKFYRPKRWSQEQILSEHIMTLILQSEQIQTPKFIPIQNAFYQCANSHISRKILTAEMQDRCSFTDQSLQTLGKIEEFYFCVWEKVAGRSPLEIQPKSLVQVGSMIARMHNLFDIGLDKQQFKRHSLTTEFFMLDSFSYIEQWGKVPAVTANRIFDIGEELIAGLGWVDTCCNFVPIHGDLHRLNLIQTTQGGQFWVVDFDDCLFGPEVQDLWLLASTCDLSTLSTESNPAHDASPFSLLCEGYERFRKLPSDSHLLVEPLRTFRMVHYMGWIAKRWKYDAFFRSTFAFFETESYWEKTLYDLEDQLELLKKLDLLDTAK